MDQDFTETQAHMLGPVKALTLLAWPEAEHVLCPVCVTLGILQCLRGWREHKTGLVGMAVADKCFKALIRW